MLSVPEPCAALPGEPLSPQPATTAATSAAAPTAGNALMAPGGVIATADAAIAERVSRAIYPGLSSNYDAGRLRSLGVAASNLLRSGEVYADACIDAARALAAALVARDCDVL